MTPVVSDTLSSSPVTWPSFQPSPEKASIRFPTTSFEGARDFFCFSLWRLLFSFCLVCLFWFWFKERRERLTIQDKICDYIPKEIEI